MKKLFFLVLFGNIIFGISLAQTKTVIGILSFRNSSENSGNNYYRNSNQSKEVVEIQDAVTDVFLKTKRFSLVEREKMDQIKSEKELQKSEDFIDGQVIEQSKSLGAEYIVIGDVSKAEVKNGRSYAPIVGSIATTNSEIDFNIKVVDVSTGEIMASNSFSGSGKGKNSFEHALDDIKPDIDKFIKDNFKVIVSIASVEEKNDKGEAAKVLIAGGSSLGMKEGDELKIYEVTELLVDGKKLTRKVTIGKIVVAKVEDENFSDCSVTEGGDEIVKKMDAKAKLKCEVINE